MTPETAPNQDSVAPFDRVLCALDGSDEALDGAFQGWRLSPGRPLTLVHVVELLDAPAIRDARPEWVHDQRQDAAALLTDARERLVALGVTSPIEVTIEEGDMESTIRYVTEGGDRKLLTMGSGEEAELAQPLPLPPPTVDRLTRRVLEAANCSVLVARRAPESGPFPLAITVGVDGSPVAAHAYEVAAAIGAITGARVRVITALKGKGPNLQDLRDASPRIPIDEMESEDPEVALLKAGRVSDLLVVGRRGVHHSRGLGSISARVAAFSPVSVLVVHRP
jgi:nucleotide-binding universal stress UspA family protein